MPLSYCPSHPCWLAAVSIPYHHVCAHNELWLGVPLVVRDVVMGLEPDPLLSFGQKPIATRLPLAKLHHCQDRVHTAGHTVISVRRTWNMNSVTKVSTAPLVPKGDQSPSTLWVCGPVDRDDHNDPYVPSSDSSNSTFFNSTINFNARHNCINVCYNLNINLSLVYVLLTYCLMRHLGLISKSDHLKIYSRKVQDKNTWKDEYSVWMDFSDCRMKWVYEITLCKHKNRLKLKENSQTDRNLKYSKLWYKFQKFKDKANVCFLFQQFQGDLKDARI